MTDRLIDQTTVGNPVRITFTAARSDDRTAVPLMAAASTVWTRCRETGVTASLPVEQGAGGAVTATFPAASEGTWDVAVQQTGQTPMSGADYVIVHPLPPKPQVG